MSNYLANQSHLALKVESSENIAVRPDTFIPLESADIKSELALSADRRMKGIVIESDTLQQGGRNHAGKIKVWGDPSTIGYILNMTLKKGSSTGDANGYTHPFTVDEPKTYTIEIPRGDYADRFFGVKVDVLTLLFEDGKLKAEIDVRAGGQVSAASLAANLTGGASSALTLKQLYDLAPNRGFVVGDSVVIGAGTANQETKVISAVETDGVTLTFATPVANAHTAGDLVYLKAQTPSNILATKDPLNLGDTLFGFGATAAAALSNAGSKTTATPILDFKLTFRNNLLNVPFSHYRETYKHLAQFRQCEITLRQLFETPEQLKKWLEVEKQGIVMIASGKLIKTTAPTTKNYLKITINKALLETNLQPLNVGEFIFDEQSFRCVYDSSDAAAISVELVNEVSTY